MSITLSKIFSISAVGALSLVPAVSSLPFSDIADNPHKESIQWMIDNHITTGWGDGTFRPREAISREAMAAFMYRYAHMNNDEVNDDPSVDNSCFTDVSPQKTIFAKEICWSKNKGIVNGYDDGKFRPHATIERQAAAAMIARLTGKQIAPVTDDVFTDVHSQSPFSAEINVLKTLGITYGYPDGSFHPQEFTQRDAVATYLYYLQKSVAQKHKEVEVTPESTIEHEVVTPELTVTPELHGDNLDDGVFRNGNNVLADTASIDWSRSRIPHEAIALPFTNETFDTFVHSEAKKLLMHDVEFYDKSGHKLTWLPDVLWAQDANGNYWGSIDIEVYSHQSRVYSRRYHNIAKFSGTPIPQVDKSQAKVALKTINEYLLQSHTDVIEWDDVAFDKAVSHAQTQHINCLRNSALCKGSSYDNVYTYSYAMYGGNDAANNFRDSVFAMLNAHHLYDAHIHKAGVAVIYDPQSSTTSIAIVDSAQ